MFELLQIDRETVAYEVVHVYEKLNEPFREAWFHDEEINWQYEEEGGGYWFAGWDGAGDYPAFLIKPQGVVTSHEAAMLPDQEL
jgi:hypothetical protein